MKVKRRRNERTRLLLLELAVVLPALALIGFGIFYLGSIHGDGAVEAAIQRDLQQVLAISEKQMNARILEMAEAARDDFAPPDEHVKEMLKGVLDRHPALAHAFIYD